MRIIVPFTRLRDETRDALAEHAHGYDVELVKVAGDDEALWNLWRDVWEAGETVVWIEHDIVIHGGVLSTFELCTSPWCTFGYPYDVVSTPGENVYHGTGCARFHGDLLREFPEVIEAVGRREGPRHPLKHWCSIDGFMQLELRQRGVQPHRHDPPVGHVDPAPSHGCNAAF